MPALVAMVVMTAPTLAVPLAVGPCLILAAAKLLLLVAAAVAVLPGQLLFIRVAVVFAASPPALRLLCLGLTAEIFVALKAWITVAAAGMGGGGDGDFTVVALTITGYTVAPPCAVDS